MELVAGEVVSAHVVRLMELFLNVEEVICSL
jgi:hypothetical protein